jgi:hypothetical protein
LEHFNEFHSEIKFELPEVFVLSRRKSGFLLREGVSEPAEFAKLLRQVLKGELEGEMTIQLPGLFPRLVPLPEPTAMPEPVKQNGWSLIAKTIARAARTRHLWE